MRVACARLLVAPVLVLLATVVGAVQPVHAATWSVPKASNVPTGSTSSLAEFETRLVVAINKARRRHGVRRIRLFDSCADRMAEGWGDRIARTGRFEHRNQMRVVRRCRANWAGETLIRGSALTPEVVVQAWLDSPGHRVIILNRKAIRAGVAVTRDSQGRMIGVLNVIRKFRR